MVLTRYICIHIFFYENPIFYSVCCMGDPQAQQKEASAGFFCPHFAQKTTDSSWDSIVTFASTTSVLGAGGGVCCIMSAGGACCGEGGGVTCGFLPMELAFSLSFPKASLVMPMKLITPSAMPLTPSLRPSPSRLKLPSSTFPLMPAFTLDAVLLMNSSKIIDFDSGFIGKYFLNFIIIDE